MVALQRTPAAQALSRAAALLVGLCALLRALELRLAVFARPLWEDEVHHNYAILKSPSLSGMREEPLFLWQYQPLLDHALRKLVWFPLLGHDERALRLPSLFWGLSLVAALFALALAQLRQRGLSSPAALLLALCAALWAAGSPEAIHEATEARHYSFVALASLLWFAALLLAEGPRHKRLAAASLLFANLHFFSLPMISLAYAGLAAGALREGRRRDAMLFSAALGAVLLCTLAVNEPQLALLMQRPPGVRTTTTLGPALRGAGELWLAYQSQLSLPLPAWGLWLGLAAAARFAPRLRALPLLAGLFAGLPLFFVYFRLRSAYPFYPRYYAAFFGLGAVSLLMVLDAGAALLEQAPRSARALALVATALLFGLPAHALGLVRDARGMKLPPANFSPYFVEYEALKQRARPLLVLQSHCFASDIPMLYLRFQGAPAQEGFTVLDSNGCGLELPLARGYLRELLARPGPPALLVLDQKEEPCSGAQPAAGLSMQRLPGVEGCVWTLDAPRSLAEVRAAADAVGFHYAPALLE